MKPKDPARNRYRIAEAKRQMIDKLGGDTVEIETDDGAVFTVEHPMFRSKATKDTLKPLADDDAEGIAAAVLGKQYDAFIEHGGDPEDLVYVFMSIGEDTQDTLAGRKRPTRS